MAQIIEAETAGRVAVVLSASRGVTNALLALVGAAERQEPVRAGLDALRSKIS